MDFGNVDEFIPPPIPGFQPLRFILETDEHNFYETYISPYYTTGRDDAQYLLLIMHNAIHALLLVSVHLHHHSALPDNSGSKGWDASRRSDID